MLYDHKSSFDVPARIGYATRLLKLTQMLDRLVATTEALELNNVLTPENRDKTIRSWCRRYRIFCRAINRLRVETLQHDRKAVVPKEEAGELLGYQKERLLTEAPVTEIPATKESEPVSPLPVQENPSFNEENTKISR